MKHNFGRNIGIMNGHHGAVLRHHGAGMVSGHSGVKSVSISQSHSRMQNVNEFLGILRKDKVLLALLCGIIITGVTLGGFLFMSISTFLS
jgi:hypothetical protein